MKNMPSSQVTDSSFTKWLLGHPSSFLLQLNIVCTFPRHKGTLSSQSSPNVVSSRVITCLIRMFVPFYYYTLYTNGGQLTSQGEPLNFLFHRRISSLWKSFDIVSSRICEPTRKDHCAGNAGFQPLPNHLRYNCDYAISMFGAQSDDILQTIRLFVA